MLIFDRNMAQACLFTCLSCTFLFEADQTLAKDVHIYLLGGQSNATGRGNAEAIPTDSPLYNAQSDVSFYYRRTLVGSTNNTLPESTIIDLAPGSGHGQTGTVYATEFGPELGIGRTLADAFPDQNVMIVKGTHGGSNLYSQWADGGVRYHNFTTTVNAATQAVIDAGDTPILMGMFWVQGEADANSIESINYEANLTDLISRVRADFFGGDDAPFVFSQLSDNQYDSLYANQNNVRQGQSAVNDSVINTSMVVTDDDSLFTVRSGDIIHFDANGQINLGNSLGQEMVALVPEPGSLALLVLGASMLTRRRRA